MNFRHDPNGKGIGSKGQRRRRGFPFGQFALARDGFEKDLSGFSPNPASVREVVHSYGASLTRSHADADTPNIGENSRIHRDLAKELAVAFGGDGCGIVDDGHLTTRRNRFF